MSEGVEIVGAGLAGCTLAWQLTHRGIDVLLNDDDRDGAASRVAAGLINPVTGKNYQPSWRISEFLPESIAFFEAIGERLGKQLWFPMPVVRLVSDKEWRKVATKLDMEEVSRWVDKVDEQVDDWRAAVYLKGGGRVDVKAFCDLTRQCFSNPDASGHDRRVYCDGAHGLMKGRLGEHRCAKGEILTVRIPGQDEDRILVGGGGWLVPIGNQEFKAGSTYEWDELDGKPTSAGLERLEQLLGKLGVSTYEVVSHEAGIRPIVRRSMPLIGMAGEEMVFNGLGSKGSLYAPGVARRLVESLVDGHPIEEELDAAKWLEQH